MAAQVRALEAENASLSARMRHAQASATSQAMRAQAWRWQSRALQDQVAIIRRSASWRITLPLRLAMLTARGFPPEVAEGKAIRHAFALAKREGVMQAVAAARAWWRRRQSIQPAASPTPDRQSGQSAKGVTLSPLVVIVAELSVPQCAKYRVWQKQEHFTRLGVPCRVVEWHDIDACLSAAATATQAILYRVPATKEVLTLIATLRANGVPFAWEVDDLIFDRDLYSRNSNLADLDPALRQEVLDGVSLYRQALLACGRGIASTEALAGAMRGAGVADVAIVENALDQQTLDAAQAVLAARVPHDGVLITYGSGTKTHDADFLQAAPALLRLLRTRPDAHLRLMGELTIPAAFNDFSQRIERVPPLPYDRYLAMLGQSDIAIAPLEPSVFNDAKSNIKFLEASVLSIPSVCSPRAQFVPVLRPGENGYLAETETEWFAALEALAEDAALRARIGAAARIDVLARYAPQAVAQSQVAPLLAPVVPRQAGVLRVLMANVFYAPRSYGGATIVVEEMARRLHARQDTEVVIATTLGSVAHQAITRGVQDGITVFGLPTANDDIIAAFDDPLAGDAFGQVLDAVIPDVVHLNAVQQLSASLVTATRARGIPVVITLHDPWWLCGRQFMVRADGTYCFQKQIDLQVCQACMPQARHLHLRMALLRDALDATALLISPSAAHRALYLAQGIEAERIVVLPNGVRLPSRPSARTPTARLRFGYVGGHEKVKGYGLVRQAFTALDRADWELVLVDNTLNLGFSSIDGAEWSALPGKVSIVPAYTQDSMEDFFASIDVLLFPSQWKESFGLTVREALARDVWVITTDGGGPAEAVTDGVNGTIIPLDGRHDGLLAAIRNLLEDGSRLSGYSNPRKHEIGDYDTQALALRALLTQVVA